MRRLLVALFLASGIVLVSPSTAIACSCATLTPEQHTKNADTVVVATVEYDTNNAVDNRVLGISVQEVYKGVAGFREKIHTSASSASCGLENLVTDEQYVFFIKGIHPGRMTSNLCTGTTKWDADVINAVKRVEGDPVEPLPTFEPGDQSPDEGTDKVRAVGIGAFVVAALAGVVIMARRRFNTDGRR